MSELSHELYQEIILDHGQRPRNHRSIDDATHRAAGDNPLCGDKITIYLKLDGETVEDLAFEASGCAISRASASMMSIALKGRTIHEVNALFDAFHDLVTTGTRSSDVDVGRLEVLGGVSRFPTRVKCATLAWHALKAALVNPGERVSTEA